MWSRRREEEEEREEERKGSREGNVREKRSTGVGESAITHTGGYCSSATYNADFAPCSETNSKGIFP